MLMDRLWPPRKGHPIELDMPPLKTSTDVLNAIISLWNAMPEGHLTADEASALSLLAQRSMEAISEREILKRIAARHGSANSAPPAHRDGRIAYITMPSPSDLIGVSSGRWPTFMIVLQLQLSELQ